MIGHRREGFVLIAVLWIIAALSAIATVALVTSRRAARAAINSSEITSASWRAEGCTESVLASIHDVLADSTQPQRVLWNQLPELRPVLPPETAFGCVVWLEPVGARIDVNAAAPATVRNVLLQRGHTPAIADSMVAALRDWIDADTDPRLLGAESEYYRARHRAVPRNAPLHAAGELLLIRGFERDTALLDYFDVYPAPVVLDRAAPDILRALPGMSDAAVSWIIRQRAAGGSVTLAVLAGALHGSAADTLSARFAELSSATVDGPSQWQIVARTGGAGGVRVAVEVIVTRDNGRPAILRRRVTIQ